MIDAALTGTAHDPLRRVRLLPAAIQIATAAGSQDQAAVRIAELEQLASRFEPTGKHP
jgi:hypothetical protein